MCGRFTQHYTWAEVHAFLSVFGAPRNLRPHYNLAPTTSRCRAPEGRAAASWSRCAGAWCRSSGRKR